MSVVEIAAARLLLYKWAAENPAAAPFSDYGTNPADMDVNNVMVWHSRDQQMLQAFLQWRVSQGGTHPVSGDLTPSSLVELQNWGVQSASGPMPPPPVTPPTTVSGDCLTECEALHGPGSGLYDPQALAACVLKCQQGAVVATEAPLPAPVTPPATGPLPAPPEPVPETTTTSPKKSKAPWVVAGLAGAALLVWMAGRKGDMQANPARTPKVRSGYAYSTEVGPKDYMDREGGSWQHWHDEDWDTVVVDGGPGYRYLGTRKIDGVLMNVWLDKRRKRYVAQTAVG